MVPCFMCDVSLDPESLFKHIKNEHRNVEEYTCILCPATFSRFSVYKNHVRSCNLPDGEMVDPEIHALFVDRNVEIENFEKIMNKSALQMACKLSANMTFPRNATFQIIDIFKKYIEAATQGLKSIIRPLVQTEDKSIVDKFASAIELSLHDVRSESVLDAILSKLDLIESLQPGEIITEEPESEPEDEQDENLVAEDSNEGEDEELSDEERKQSEVLTLPPEIKIEKVIMMPVIFQFKKFFELPNVYAEIKTYMEKVQQSDRICNFVNGSVWKDKLKAYNKTDVVIPYHVYFDQAQINNALGSHCALGKEMLGYYTFPCIPPEYNSRLENIFPAILHPGHYNKTYGNERCYNNLIDVFNTLAHEGILLNIDGVEERVYFLLGVMQGDNLEVNSVLDFTKSFRSHYHCRVCKQRRTDMERATSEDPSLLRTVENYESDVLTNDYKKTGVVKEACFNNVASFHVTTSCSMDLTHDIAEGMQHYEIAEILLNFIKNRNIPLTIDILNSRMKNFNYGEIEKGNAQTTIFMNHLKRRKFKMSASEMMCFARHLGLMIGDLIPEGDPVWKFYLGTMEFVNLCFLPSYSEDELGRLENVIAKKNQSFVTLFKSKLKPKHHYSIHYPSSTRKYGPLRYLKTIRYEGKHRVAKNYTKNTNSRRSISFSLGRKLQYNFASRIINGEGLEDKIVFGRNKQILFSEVKFDKTIEPSQHLNVLRLGECYFTERITVNGILFSTKLYLPFVEEPYTKPVKNHILKICKIMTTSKTDVSSIYLICEKYNRVSFDQHFGCYSVDKNIAEEKMVIITAKEFLIEHKYPVHLHQIGMKYMFKYKYF